MNAYFEHLYFVGDSTDNPCCITLKKFDPKSRKDIRRCIKDHDKQIKNAKERMEFAIARQKELRAMLARCKGGRK